MTIYRAGTVSDDYDPYPYRNHQQGEVNVKCIRCEADPQPANFGSPRNCAFDADGNFTSDNWNCATINALLEHQQGDEHFGDDEHMEVVSVRRRWVDEDGYPESGSDGWIVTARYKHRGRTDYAAHITRDGSSALTLKLVEDVLAAYEPAPAADAVGLSVEDSTDSPRA